MSIARAAISRTVSRDDLEGIRKMTDGMTNETYPVQFSVDYPVGFQNSATWSELGFSMRLASAR
jgi:hypothetical protein